jgi:hypothetical protein
LGTKLSGFAGPDGEKMSAKQGFGVHGDVQNGRSFVVS